MGTQFNALNANLIFLIQKVVVATSPNHNFVWGHLLVIPDVGWVGASAILLMLGAARPFMKKSPAPWSKGRTYLSYRGNPKSDLVRFEAAFNP